jgi:hypothetical protein
VRLGANDPRLWLGGRDLEASHRKGRAASHAKAYEHLAPCAGVLGREVEHGAHLNARDAG